MNDTNKPRSGRPSNSRSGNPGEDKPIRSRGFKDRPASRDSGSGHGKGQKGDRPAGARGFRDRPGPDSVHIKSRRDGERSSSLQRDDASSKSAENTERPPERIAKRLARAGIASRREAETLIEAGRVALNGKVLTSPAVNVTMQDRIEVDGKPIPVIERSRLWLYHKPAGLVSSNRDPEGRATVFDNLPADLPRVLTIGRLDINTEGLLLLTNDGGLARQLELPQTGWLRRYRVRAHGRITQDKLDELKNGIAVDGVFYGSIHATLEREQGTNVWIEMALREGKNREIKNVLGALGLDVNRLIRISYGPFQLGDLAEGHVLEIRGKVLREQLGETLIEESGANFDAPVINTFPNTPVAKRRDDVTPLSTPVRKRGDWVSGSEETGRAQRKDGGERRGKDFAEETRDRWSTKPPRKTGPGKKPMQGKASQQDEDRAKPRSRSTNVWMAPGARPQSAKARDRPAPRTDKKGGRKRG